ncbi:MAG: hypothetical protein ACTHOU_20565 [Aureliella sp.]
MPRWMQRAVVVGCLFGCLASAVPTRGQVPADFDANQAERNPGDVVRLEDQLVNGLRVVTVEQRLYVSQVVALVDSGQLPRAMVNVVYTWALKRNPHVPLPYFQIALRALAERRGIAVP